MNKVKSFSGSYHKIKRVLTSFQVFRSLFCYILLVKIKSKFCMKSKLVKIIFIKNFLTNIKKLKLLSYLFELILCAVLFDYSEIVAIVKMRAVIEKGSTYYA